MINQLIHHNSKAIMTTVGLVNYLMSRNLCFDSSLISEIIGQWKLTCGMWDKELLKNLFSNFITSTFSLE
ncbi:hypothetical protein DB42_CO00160 [Neochlamydia sp. EPS4]|uniref:hypothetical protein n=1 Tax=Neochlamydia sp. EPS4 TaxID=1478175 RepID=UPI000583A713|nr:hypothetical protein [Neochlamydia sp. EPS4]KIC72981.1 hypothetical protein DB42_CO00160 [Neochlamydia sp. EPS4]